MEGYEKISCFPLSPFHFMNRDLFVQISPLSAPSMWIAVSGVLLFIPNKQLVSKLGMFGKFDSGFKMVSLGCKDPILKHVQSLSRQVFMFLDPHTLTQRVSFRVKHGYLS